MCLRTFLQRLGNSAPLVLEWVDDVQSQVLLAILFSLSTTMHPIFQARIGPRVIRDCIVSTLLTVCLGWTCLVVR